MPNLFFRGVLRIASASGWYCALSLLAAANLAAQLPDLTVDQPLLQNSVSVETRTFAADSCTVVEGCALPGTRKLLLFDTGFINISSTDLIIGDPTQRPDIFHFSPCHGHYHMDGVAAYELINAAGDTVVTGRKQGFCLRDNQAAVAGAGPGKYDCDNQGLTAGWEDIYDKSLDCQWLDISDVLPGTYILRVVCNPDAMFEESNYDNNVVDVSITLSSTNKPPTPKPPKCDQEWWKKHCKKPQTWKDLKDKWGEKWWKKCKIQKCECEDHGHHDGKGEDDDDDDDDDDHDGKGNDDDDHEGKGGCGKDDHQGKDGKHKGKGKGGHDQGKHKGKMKGRGK